MFDDLQLVNINHEKFEKREFLSQNNTKSCGIYFVYLKEKTEL